jgi:hypothetical protein
MRDGLIATDIAAIAVVLVCCLRALEYFTTNRWRHRLGAIGSPLLRPPAYRVLFVLVLAGALLISVLPEAAFVLPALDAVGLDIVTILAALELRHYFVSLAQLVGLPTNPAVYLRVAAQVVSRCGDVLRTNPVLWLYACMWLLIWIRTFMGTMSVSSRSVSGPEADVSL